MTAPRPPGTRSRPAALRTTGIRPPQLALALVRVSTRRPRSVLFCVLAISVLALFALPSIELRLDARSLVPEAHPRLQASDAAAAVFGSRDVVVLLVEHLEGEITTAEGLRLIVDLSDGLRQLPGVDPSSVLSLATAPRLAMVDDVLDPEPLLSNGVDSSVAARVAAEVSREALDDGILLSRDRRVAAVYAEVDPSPVQEIATRLQTLIEATRPAAGYRVSASGSVLAQAKLGEAAMRDLVRLAPAIFLALAGVLWIAFGSATVAAIALAEVGLSMLWTAGLLGALGQPVFITLLALPAVLVAIGLADDVFVLDGCLTLRDTGPGQRRLDPGCVVEALTPLLVPILCTTATTVLALASLAAVGLEPQRVLGRYGAVALVLSTLLTLSLVPALLVLLQPRGGHSLGRRWRLHRRAHPATSPWRLALPLVGIAALAVWTGGTLRIDDSWLDNLPADSPVVAAAQTMDDRLAGANTLELLVDTGTAGGLLVADTFAALSRFEARLEARPEVGAVTGVLDLVRRLDQHLVGSDREPTRPTAHAASPATEPLSSARIAQTLMLLRSLLADTLRRQLDDDDRRLRLVVFLPAASFASVESVVSAIHSEARSLPVGVSIVPFGDAWVGHQTIDLLVRGQLRSLGAALLLEGLLLALLFRSAKLVAWTLLPVVVSIVLTFAGVAASGFALGVASSMFAAVALGIGIDYATHWVTRWWSPSERSAEGRSAEGRRQSARAAEPAIVVSALTVGIAFGLLTVSSIPPNRALGALVALSLVITAGVTVWTLPHLVALDGDGR